MQEGARIGAAGEPMDAGCFARPQRLEDRPAIIIHRLLRGRAIRCGVFAAGARDGGVVWAQGTVGGNPPVFGGPALGLPRLELRLLPLRRRVACLVLLRCGQYGDAGSLPTGQPGGQIP